MVGTKLQRDSSFRTDINGLRAWAVVAVILYHFDIRGFSGGFVGVDIFFVISGLLMTGIAIRSLEQLTNDESKSFFSDFYIARARRIVPALVALCAALICAGWTLLTPVDYKELGVQSVAALSFLSNFKFWREAGYFDVTAHEKWLLHTWSLSVEWQFYLVLPVVLWASWKWRPNRTFATVVVLVGAVVSLGLAIFLTQDKPKAAFFLLPTRAWEMLVGGLIYLSADRCFFTLRQRTIIESIGLLLIVGSVALFDVSSSWPGWRALVPVFGAALVLVSCQSTSVWTNNRAAQWIGTRSYSLYLWHWPIVVVLVYLGLRDSTVAIALGLVCTLALGHLSWRWIEIEALHWLRSKSNLRAGLYLFLTTMLVATFSGLVVSKNGVEGRHSQKIEQVAAESLNGNPRLVNCLAKEGTTSPSCIYGGNRVRAVLLGDSHANAVASALSFAAPDSSDGIVEWSYARCPTLLNAKVARDSYRPNERCSEFLSWTTKKLKEFPTEVPLVIVNRTTRYAIGHNEKWENTANIPSVYFSKHYNLATPEFLKEFSKNIVETACFFANDRTVYLVRPFPEMGVDVPKTMARAMALGNPVDVFITLDEYRRRHDFVWSAQNQARDLCGVKILDPIPYLCSGGKCSGAINGRPLYSDDDHLSEYGNKVLIPMFSEIFKDL